MTDHTDPPRIYLQPECCADPNVGREWARQPGEECDEGVPWTPYVRAEWLPIATAPKDGTSILVACGDGPGGQQVCRYHAHTKTWRRRGWWRVHRPTHWMLLPEPPGDEA